METPGTIRISLQRGEWVTSLDFSDAYFHIPIHTRSQKYLGFHFQNQSYQFRALPFSLSTAPMEFTCVVKPPQRILPSGHPIHPRPLPGVGLDGEPSKIRVGTQTGVRICGLPVQPLTRTGQTDPEPLGVNSSESGNHSSQSDLPSQEVHVTDRPSYSNGKTGAPGQTSYETHSVAPQKTLESPRISGKGDSNSKVSLPAPTMVDQGNKCLARSTSAPFASCHSNLYRRLKRRLGCSLRQLYSKQHLVSSRKPSSCKFPGTKSCLAGPKKVRAHSTGESRSSCHRQQTLQLWHTSTRREV